MAARSALRQVARFFYPNAPDGGLTTPRAARPGRAPQDDPIPDAEVNASSVYDQDGLRSVHNHEFMRAPRFAKAYARGVQAVGGDYHWHWRVHVGLWAASAASLLEGDFVECGTNRGFLASAIMDYLEWDSLGKRFWLLDTFGGMDMRYVSPVELTEGIADKNRTMLDSGFYTTDVETVRRNFAEWRNVEIVQGPVPETLPRVRSKTLAFLHLDMNCSPPEIAALEHFWSRIVPGGIVLLDDYAYAGYRPQKIDTDAFCRAAGVAVLALPTGQGLILKPAR